MSFLSMNNNNASRLAMGTAALGMPYGISAAEKGERLTRQEAIRLLHSARDSGIVLFDTAPGYGESEAIVGEAFARDHGISIATKVDCLDDAESITLSVDRSLQVLKREQLEMVQIHNATPELLAQDEIMDTLQRFQESGKIGKIGASVYGEAAAVAVLAVGGEVLQVACNLLDQRMRDTVIPQAEQRGGQLLFRSIFLKGVLTAWGKSLSGELLPHKQAAEQIVESLGCDWPSLAEYALRFVLGCSEKGYVLIGVTTEDELKAAIGAEDRGGLSPNLQAVADSLGIEDESILNPSLWPSSEQISG